MVQFVARGNTDGYERVDIKNQFFVFLFVWFFNSRAHALNHFIVLIT